MSDDLRERVARALNARCFDGCEDGEAGFRACVDPPCPCRAAADAAIAIVLEEAARCAEAKADEWATEWRKGMKCDSHLEGKSDGADDVATAIRALATK